MTIAQLLSTNGAQVPRYITIEGRTVFTDVTLTATGYIHTSRGAVTPVAEHTFHHGLDPEDKGGEPWWADETALRRHVDAVAQAFPDFTFVPAQVDSSPGWTGKIDTGRGVFELCVMLRRDGGLPFAKVLSRQPLGRSARGLFIYSPHLYLSGALCIADQSDWDAEEHTAATAIAWAAHWLAAFTEWRITTRWPVVGYQPNAL